MPYINNLNTHKGHVGKLGEDFACEFLIDKGHIILERNYKNKIGEIDIISKTKEAKGDKKIHIIEVKTSQSSNVRAEENMNFVKMRKVAKLAEIYMKSVVFKGTVSCETVFSVDFIGVYLNSDYSLKEIKYIENLEIY